MQTQTTAVAAPPAEQPVATARPVSQAEFDEFLRRCQATREGHTGDITPRHHDYEP